MRRDAATVMAPRSPGFDRRVYRVETNMRRLTSGQARTWLTSAEELWMSLRRRVAPHLRSSGSDGRSRLAAHGFAMGVVAGAVLLRRVLDASANEPQFWLLHVAIALSAAYGGTASALVAALLSVLIARVGSAVPLSTALLFGRGRSIARNRPSGESAIMNRVSWSVHKTDLRRRVD